MPNAKELVKSRGLETGEAHGETKTRAEAKMFRFLLQLIRAEAKMFGLLFQLVYANNRSDVRKLANEAAREVVLMIRTFLL